MVDSFLEKRHLRSECGEDVVPQVPSLLLVPNADESYDRKKNHNKQKIFLSFGWHVGSVV